MSVFYMEKPKNLVESISSILTQTIPPNEIVLVKDGTLTYELEQIIQDFVQHYPKLFTIIEIEQNKGLGNALQLGIVRCTNELIARMDSDDIAAKNRCEKQLNIFMKNPQLSIVGSNVAEFSGTTNNITAFRNVPKSHLDIIAFAKRRSPFNHPSVMYKKSHVLDCGNYSNWKHCQDYELFIKMLANGYQAYNIQENLLYMRTNDLHQRRKSKQHLKYFIKSRKTALNSGIAGWNDFILCIIAQLMIYIVPTKITQKIYKRFLRNSIEEINKND